MSPSIEAVVFDLYGTLIRIGKRHLHRGLPRVLGVEARPWIELVRHELLTTRFPDGLAFVRFIRERLAPELTPAVDTECLAVVEAELASVQIAPGAVSILSFLKRRGYKLGLISNLTSVHKEPLSRFEIETFFDAMSFSCDEGVAKPEPRIYLDLSARLGVAPGSVLVVGDSLANDVRAPRALGMKALHLSSIPPGSPAPDLGRLGFCFLGGVSGPAPLLSDGSRVRLPQAGGAIRDFAPLVQEPQGRYNLVARARLEEKEGGASVDVFCKRFLFPEAAYVEEFSHQLMAAMGFSSCQARVLSALEPCLVVSRAPGRKFAPPVSPELAFEIARHCAAAYIMANADLRPRNAFVSYAGGHPVVTMVDLEHCLFNLALDVEGIDEPLRPQSFDALSEDELQGRVLKHVLTERTTRRAMGTFLKVDGVDEEPGRSFKAGWVAGFRQIQERRERLLALIEDRAYREPYLIIGTQSYRRAMARLDIQDVRQRMEQDPEGLFPRLAALQKQPQSEAAAHEPG